jgi:lysophospholipase L1-like esterase
MRKSFTVIVAFAVLSIAIAVLPSDAARPRFRRIVVVGDSLLAGFGSGGYVDRGRPGQEDSAAKVFARRARAALPLPRIGRPGFPPQLTIEDDNRNGALDPGEVRRSVTGLGFRTNPDTRVRNLAVPGEDLTSVFEEISPGDVARRILSGQSVSGPEALKLVILGLPLRGGSVSQLSRARELQPTFVLVWLGNNDVLGMATRTDPGAESLTVAEFGDRFRRLLGSLADTGTPMAVANLPDVTEIAALRRAAGDVSACRNADGTLEAVGPDDLLSIDLDRDLLPTPPCSKVLSVAERATVRAAVEARNAEIAAAIAEVEAARGVPIALVDVFSLLDAASNPGIDIDGDGAPDLNTRYLGGIFSLDGIHPTRTGHALIANAFIDAVNARFGESIPHASLSRIAARDPLVGTRFRPSGEPPFGLLGGAGDEVETFREDLSSEIEGRIDDVRKHLVRDRIDDVLRKLPGL